MDVPGPGLSGAANTLEGQRSMLDDDSIPPEPLGDEPRQFKLLVQSVMDYAIYMLDTEGYVRSWNTGGHRIKGYSAEEIIGQHFSKFYLPEDAARDVPTQSLLTARTEGKYESEGWRMRKDGSRFRASVVIDPIWQGQTLVGYAKVTRDVTERYEAQSKLKEAERELIQAQKIEAVGKLAFGLAHDFNNLLCIVVNTLDAISSQPGSNSRTAELVDAGLRAADRGALLTKQLLSFAQGQKLASEPNEVNSLLSRSTELYRRAAGTTIDLNMVLAADLPFVLVDAAQFEAGILNLITNSRDAMPRGGTISLSTGLRYRTPPAEADAPVRAFVCVTVTDNGSGMSEEVMRRASEPFFTTKEVGKGSGLGLSQVFGFAAQSGGFATISGEPERGTTVQLCLPPLPA
jgi:PAS domain S-box-containing protein